ncbi:MAG: phosphoenolpyruvate--protein phosphotransferase [Lentisphaerae bacterium RIFOXYC12_FULL_60_16]|nr:MAG: phosphoenolpyruvate--protein phosphotransferase [Lentisphaerae bacterium RIFOXYC12_FULL_60_16]OGV77262.1 MAG: phosphoenolpyruvate--protein phosphotransferase [Lentisphaerae bacterium RIFOXYB12_FULL_60_10]
MDVMDQAIENETVVQGVALSGGCSVAKVCRFNERRHENLPMFHLDQDGVEREHGRVDRAIDVVDTHLETIRKRVETEVGKAEAEIFVAHRMILKDPDVVHRIHDFIDTHSMNAEASVAQAFDYYESRLLKLESEVFRDRANDIGEVKHRLLDVLSDLQPTLQCQGEAHCQRGRNRIVVADELTPAMTVDLDASGILGFITRRGGVNSHGAILARALGIPAISGVGDLMDRLPCGTEVLVNGGTGSVVIWPLPETIAKAGNCRREAIVQVEVVEPIAAYRVLANVNTLADLEPALAMKAEGIGLYRTEIEVIAAGRYFSEDEWTDRMVRMVRAMQGKPVTIRLLDVGSDKTLPFMDIPPEENPSLGWRGLRLLLGRPELLGVQARALARASMHGPVNVLYPMVVDVDQFREGRRLFDEAIRGCPSGTLRHGVMFEVPSACLAADALLDVADFGSIGTNDLLQYFFAVDRDNERVAYDYHANRPVFWNLIRSIVDEARRRGKTVSVCGELAGDPDQVGRLYQAGIRDVSVSARRIPAIRTAYGALNKPRENQPGGNAA